MADKAADHFKARDAAIKVRERSNAEYVMPEINKDLWEKAFPAGGQPAALVPYAGGAAQMSSATTATRRAKPTFPRGSTAELFR